MNEYRKLGVEDLAAGPLDSEAGTAGTLALIPDHSSHLLHCASAGLLTKMKARHPLRD